MNYRLSKTAKRTFAGLVTGIGIAIFLFWLSMGRGLVPGYMTQLEHIFYDLTFKLATLDNYTVETDSAKVQQNLTLEDRIQIVDIDERSLDRLGAYNLWPRTHHARVLDILASGGASAVTFDILFKNADFGAEKTRELLDVVRQIKPEIPWEQDSARIRSALNHDSILVHAVKRDGNAIVCGLMASRKIYVHETQWRPLSEPAWQQRIGLSGTLPDSLVPDGSVENMDLLDNIYPELARAGRLGLVNVVPDDDGVHRKVPLLHGFPNPELYPDAPVSYYPIISLQTVLHLFGLQPSDLRIEPGRYMEIGQPLGIYRDSSGLLHSTYPNLTWPMLRSLLSKKQELQKMSTDSTQAHIEEISTRVVSRRDSAGAFTVEIFNAQMLDDAMVQALLAPGLSWDVLAKANDKPIALNPRITVNWSTDDNLPLLYNNETEDEASIDRYTWETLRANAPEIAVQPPGTTRYLSADMDLHYVWKTKTWRSNFIILNSSVIRDLFRLDTATVNALKKGVDTLRLGDKVRIPIDEKNRMQIFYKGRYAVPSNQRSFKQISYYDILAGRIDPGVYQGKVFILGSTAPALFDLVSAPHESEFPGVLIHATLLENILNNAFLSILGDREQFLLVLVIALLCALVASFLKPLFSLPLLVVAVVGYFAVSYSYFMDGLYIGVARQVLTMVLSFFGMMVLRYIFEEREKRFLHDAFRQYISPELIDQMVKNEVKPTLGGTKTDLSAFFTDIASFSTFSEKIGDPSRLVELLNEYLSAMTDILSAHQGTLDKYEGDAIVAFFGAPMPLPNHRQSACITALAMQKKLMELRRKWASEGTKWPSIVHDMHMRVGINSGDIVTGNMGSTMRKNYTMMGDAVNLAARLESAAKQYGAYIQISRETLDGLEPGTIVYRSLDRVRVVGKSEPVETFELLALRSDATPRLLQLVDIWERARNCYTAMQWEEASTLFRQCLEFEPHHPDRDPGSKTTPAHIYLARCEAYQTHPPVPPGETWDGIYTATEK